MARKQIKVSRKILFTWFILTGMIFLLTPKNWTANFQFAFARIFRWPLTVGRNISLSGKSQQGRETLLSRKEAQYKNHIANLEEQLRKKNRKIELLQKIKDRFTALEGAKLVVSEIIKVSVDNTHAELIINRGRIEGLRKNQFVLGDNGIIGVISGVSPRQAKVKLITDKSFKAPVKISESNKKGGIMCGNGDYTAKIKMMKVKPKIGDKVYINDSPGLLDVAMIVGKVANCERNEQSQLLWDITVVPACDIQTLNTVTVIIMNPEN
jgi:rod shape-determining protein MreC